MATDTTQQDAALVALGVPRGDTWELGGQNNGFTAESPDGQTLLGYVLSPATTLLNGKFQPGHQYWLWLDTQQPVPSTFRLMSRTSMIPSEALDRNDWEDHPSSLFDGATTVSYATAQLGPDDSFYRVNTTVGGQDQVSGWLLRQTGGAPTHTWHGNPGGLQADAQNPDALLIATQDSIRFSTASQPQAGTQVHPRL